MNERGPMPESAEERVLRENLSVRALSPEALQRIRQATEAEWRANIEPARRRWIPYAAAASAVLLALAGTWSLLGRGPASVSGASVARLERADPAGVVEVLRLWRDAKLNVGQEIRDGHDFASRGATLFALHGGGNLLVTLLFLSSWLVRRDDATAPSGLALALSFAGAAVSLLTAWLGGELVAKLGVGVYDDANVQAPSSLDARSRSSNA